MSDSRHVVVRSIERAAPETIAGLAEMGVATAHEAAGRIGLLDPGVRPIQEGARVAGSAITALCQAGDNMMIHAAVEVVGVDDMLVVATTAPSTDGMFGELLATSLRARGCAGLVIDAGVRDVAALREMRFPVWARAIHAQGTVKERPGAVNIPITIGEARVTPGDVLIADDDGVVVVPRDSAHAVLGACEDREAQEHDMRRRLASGELGLDIYGLREKLDDLGVLWVDGPDGS